MSKIFHFEIPAEDPERAIKFYESTFGWNIQKWQGPIEYWLVMTGDKSEEGIQGAIMRKTDELGVINTIRVANFDESFQKITTQGGTVVSGKITVPGVGYMAYFKDPDGNLLSIMQEDESVK